MSLSLWNQSFSRTNCGGLSTTFNRTVCWSQKSPLRCCGAAAVRRHFEPIIVRYLQLAENRFWPGNHNDGADGRKRCGRKLLFSESRRELFQRVLRKFSTVVRALTRVNWLCYRGRWHFLFWTDGAIHLPAINIVHCTVRKSWSL